MLIAFFGFFGSPSMPGNYVGTQNMYNEDTDGFKLNNVLKSTCKQDTTTIICMGDRFLPLRKVKTQCDASGEHGLLALVHAETGTEPGRGRFCLDFF